MVKYPYILGKEEYELQKYFNVLNAHEVSNEQAIQLLVDCPKLISMDLENQIKEICFLFNLYHKITEKEVFEIFSHFPYLFCCEPDKI